MRKPVSSARLLDRYGAVPARSISRQCVRRRAGGPTADRSYMILQFHSFLIAPRDLIPVDDVEESGDVVETAVLVVQVIGLLPHVQAQDRRATRKSGKATHTRMILIGAAFDQQLALFPALARPPAPTEANLGRLGEAFLELVESAQVAFDRLSQPS